MKKFSFHIEGKDPGGARLGRIRTPHGEVATPVFMPVGTQGTVKAMTPANLLEVGTQMVLANTYHLYLRPGHEQIRELGGLHRFMGWDGPILTDSGGYQVFSLGPLRKISEQGVRFQSHLDGSRHDITPESAIAIQESLGADIIMAFDECAPYPSTLEYTRRSSELTLRWAKRCKDSHKRSDQALFGIVQGGMFPELRVESAKAIVGLGFDGYAIGGLSVGETRRMMFEMVDAAIEHLPEDSPRYMMGVGMPLDILEAIGRGVDMFDCVIPTRNARNGTLFTSKGKLSIKRAEFASDARPPDEQCDCYTCRNFSRAYLRHLFQAKEILASVLNTLHSLHFYMGIMEGARKAIAQKKYMEYYFAFKKSFEGVAPRI